VIAVDTQLLVYAHREESEWHDRASAHVRALAEGPAPWAIPWPCIHEFVSTVTHPRIYDPPTPVGVALDQIDQLFASPSLLLLSEGRGHWSVLRNLIEGGRVSGPAVHDARVAAVCLANLVDELWTADRDFGRFPSLRHRNPLVDAR
jgi:toxin-antitoxin system PIN domain toxin